MHTWANLHNVVAVLNASTPIFIQGQTTRSLAASESKTYTNLLLTRHACVLYTVRRRAVVSFTAEPRKQFIIFMEVLERVIDLKP